MREFVDNVAFVTELLFRSPGSVCCNRKMSYKIGGQSYLSNKKQFYLEG